jgi:histone H3/H4
VKIETKDDFARALERLRRRDPEVLAAFILSLVQNAGSVGEHVRKFIVGEDVAEAAKSVRGRISGLSVPGEYEYRHARPRNWGEP